VAHVRSLAPTLLLLAAAACQQGPPPGGGPPSGAVTPTVAGAADAGYGSLAAAKAAFTRTGGTLTATLEDASWIRLEGDPAGAEKRHRAYFEFGYTSFEVTLRSLQFTQPTAEQFLLEDSSGQRLTGRPISYEGALRLEDNRWWTNRFALSFPHTLSADVRWIRLTRVSDGSQVEWTFPAAPAAR
jgi:hypothetical protein